MLIEGFLNARDMEDVVNFSTLWKLQLISYCPYPPADSVRSKETWLQFLRSASFNGGLPVWLQPQID
jgi:hypothetical protein